MAGETTLSHPSRGAWIEICRAGSVRGWWSRRTPHGVRGLKYRPRGSPMTGPPRSHPSRGAWIEISAGKYSHARSRVAPLTGCVD